MGPDDPQSGPPQAASAGPISYRRIDPAPREWRVVASFVHAGDWHAAKAVLERNGITARMGGNSLDETALLVPATEVFWAAELIRLAKEPGQELERSLGFLVVVNSHANPPPLPRGMNTDDVISPPLTASAASMPVVPIDPHAQSTPERQYGCLLPILWTSLLIVLGLVLLLLFACFFGNN
jgi:hypothetical protein